VGPRAGLNIVEKILAPPGIELRALSLPALNQSPYRLRYPGSTQYILYRDGGTCRVTDYATELSTGFYFRLHRRYYNRPITSSFHTNCVDYCTFG
jgi:hypothetical protein